MAQCPTLRPQRAKRSQNNPTIKVVCSPLLHKQKCNSIENLGDKSWCFKSTLTNNICFVFNNTNQVIYFITIPTHASQVINLSGQFGRNYPDMYLSVSKLSFLRPEDNGKI